MTYSLARCDIFEYTEENIKSIRQEWQYNNIFMIPRRVEISVFDIL